MSKLFRQIILPVFVLCILTMHTTSGYAQTPDAPDQPQKVYLPFVAGVAHQAEQSIPGQTEATEQDFAGDSTTLETPTGEDDPENQVVASAVTPIRIDATQDAKALGYPDSRKVVRRRANEQLFVAYRKKFNNSYRIFVATSLNNGAAWTVTNGGLPIDPALNANFTQRVPSIAVDYADTLHVVWYGADAQSSKENDHQIRYMRSKNGGATWEKGTNPLPRINGYAAGELWQEHPVIYALDGTILIVWEGRVPCSPAPCTPSPRVKFIKSTNGGDTWSAIQTLPEFGDRSFSRPTLVAARDQQTLYVVAYATVNNTSQIVWIKSANLGTTWATGWQYIKSDGQDQRHVSIAMDSTDRLHVVWRQKPSGSAYSRILYALYDTKKPTVAWATQWLPAAKSNNHQFFPTVTLDGSDRVWVAWSEASSDPTGNAYGFPNENPLIGDIYAATPTASGGWQKTLYAINGKQGLYPVLRYQRYGRRALVDLVWLAGDGTENCSGTGCTIQYARLAGQ